MPAKLVLTYWEINEYPELSPILTGSRVDGIANPGFSAVQSQKAVTAYFSSKQLLPSGLADQLYTPYCVWTTNNKRSTWSH